MSPPKALSKHTVSPKGQNWWQLEETYQAHGINDFLFCGIFVGCKSLLNAQEVLKELDGNASGISLLAAGVIGCNPNQGLHL